MKFSPLVRHRIVLSVTVILVGTGSFACGRLSVLYYKEPLQIDERSPVSEQVRQVLEQASHRESSPGGAPPSSTATPPIQASTEQSSPQHAFVASKSGTKYYPIDCNYAQRIKEENRVYFTNEEEAKGAGYELTTACSK